MNVKTIHYEPGEYHEEGKKRRSKAKGLQLGLTYGMGSARLAKELDVEYDEADKILKDFFSTYKAVADWREFNQVRLKTYGFMETALGRRRRLPDIFLEPIEVKVYDDIVVDNIFPNIPNSTIKVLNKEQSKEETKSFYKLDWRKKEAKKLVYKALGYEIIDNGAFLASTNTQCTNSVIQGSAADMTKLAMIEIANSQILKDCDAHLRFLVHDEILIECPIKYKDIVAKEFVDCLIRAPKNICQVNMACDLEKETSWRAGHLSGLILKTFKKDGKEAVYLNYPEYNREDLDKIMNETFDIETEELRPFEKNS